MNVSNRIEIIPTGKGDDIFFAFTPNSEGKMLSEMLDEGMNQLRKNGKLNDLLGKYGIHDWK
jgi:ABC-type amino acid transport substrate-binding protein